MKPSTLIALCCLISSITFGQKSTKIYVSDIDNFWIAYDSVKTTTDTVKQVKFIQALYLDKATDGLKDFMVSRQHSAKRHLLNILNYPKFWISLRPKTLKIKSESVEIKRIISNLKKKYPDFKSPAIYFTIGVLNSGGTTSPGRVLIGSEIACSDKSVDATELSRWLQGVFKLNSSILQLVAHELGHTQQKDGDSEEDGNSNLLGYCLVEGSCDFIAELIYKPVTTPYMIYGKLHEQQLWKEFQKEMLGKNTKNWLYNGDDAPNGVADLGYFMGYVICKSYYNNAKNKKDAVKRIIELKRDKESVINFLSESKYNGGQRKK